MSDFTFDDLLREIDAAVVRYEPLRDNEMTVGRYMAAHPGMSRSMAERILSGLAAAGKLYRRRAASPRGNPVWAYGPIEGK